MAKIKRITGFFQKQNDHILRKKRIEYEALHNLDLNETCESFDCDICIESGIEPKQSVILKECLHVFCKYNH